ncbi:hypothetical protein [Prolixibacter sp. NT017]|uniref:hypothetical protein n=1 Tax=Prolixibacter sp. NT017 TaxID=2652390 RepID=UPI00127763DD|nr:hypothetical protein [Prolixibacter sp. NT017]GET25860.1 hypothetical protein NT017_21890 [Prolixibacter sp. NT017]
MKEKILETEFFKIRYPLDWEYEIVDNYIHTIFDEHGVGAFQFSSYVSRDTELKFNINEEQKEFENSIIKTYPNFDAIFFTDTISDNEYFIAKWIIGKGNKKIFLTYSVDKKSLNRKRQKKEMEKIESIINELELK